MIRLTGLNKFYNRGRQNEIHVINDVTLTFPETGLVALFGKSGCGKTTLLNVIGGLDGFDSGSLTVDGQDIRRHTDDIRNRLIGFVFQNYNLNKSESCLDNVSSALRLCGMTDEEEILRRSEAALSGVGMDKYKHRLPDTLSGGQQQRVAIARALVKNPRILLADEPTGNLDSSNTLKIMDLLKAISRNRLVLLVTHESDLVDLYCDSVIELSDGRVLSVRENTGTPGASSLRGNTVYLGELPKTSLSGENALLEYYGDPLPSPIRLRLVHTGGRTYLSVDSPGVTVLGDNSETVLLDGVYREDRAEREAASLSFALSLPPLEESSTPLRRPGRLFTLLSSIKSGYSSHFKDGKQSKRGKKLLRRCLALFAAWAVFSSAIFGTSLRTLLTARQNYDKNVFYVYTPSGEVSSLLSSSLGSDSSGVDWLRLQTSYPSSGVSLTFSPGNFETFSLSSDSFFEATAVILGHSLSESLPLLSGSRDSLSDRDIFLSSSLADRLLKQSPLGYISDYSDLVGLTCSLTSGGLSTIVRGVVSSPEPCVYLSDSALASDFYKYSPLSLLPASSFGYDLSPGETILAVRDSSLLPYLPQPGDSLTVQGLPLTVRSLALDGYDYSVWVSDYDGKRLSPDEWFSSSLASSRPDLVPGSEEFSTALSDYSFFHRYEYCDYYYSSLDVFLRQRLIFDPYNPDLYVYLNEGVYEALLYLLNGSDPIPCQEYISALQYKELYGRYPTPEELESALPSLPDPSLKVDSYRDLYWSVSPSSFLRGTVGYLLSDSDYLSLLYTNGPTDPSAFLDRSFYSENFPDVGSGDSLPCPDYYTLLHSTDPSKTASWLSSLSLPVGPSSHAFYTPDDIFRTMISDEMEGMLSSLVSTLIFLGVMSLCMYFIMRSLLLSRVKEIGIYRAIGVSRSNLLFRFLVETGVLFSLTAFLGYLLSSLFLLACFLISPLTSQLFYYPWGLALSVLFVLLFLSLFFGILPVLLLLRKSPSQILAKYDI